MTVSQLRSAAYTLFSLLYQSHANSLSTAEKSSPEQAQRRRGDLDDDGPDLQDFISGELSEKSKWAEYRGTLKREKGER